MAYLDQGFVEQIQPDLTKKGTLTYDVPERAVSGSRLQVRDLFSDAKGQVELGL